MHAAASPLSVLMNFTLQQPTGQCPTVSFANTAKRSAATLDPVSQCCTEQLWVSKLGGTVLDEVAQSTCIAVDPQT